MRFCLILLLTAFYAPAWAVEPYTQGHVYPRYRDDSRTPGHRYADPTADGYYIRPHEPNQARHAEWTKPDLGATSICVEVDDETGGEKYRLPVEDGSCPRVETVKSWSKPEEWQQSRCYSVDIETGGLRYRRLERDTLCTKPEVAMVWLKAENEAKESCYEVDAETRGMRFRHSAESRKCPRTVNPYVAFGKYEPLLKPAVPFVDRASGGGRMPASLAKPIPEEEMRDPKEFWEDPEDMIRHVPDDSRKGEH
jgi:hypothetical protein